MKIGWIGTGVMGLSMCKHLLNAQYSLAVYNRTADKAKPLLELGAEWMSPQEMASKVDVLFLMLGFPRDVEDMCFGENGVIRHMKEGYILRNLGLYWSIIQLVSQVSLKESGNRQVKEALEASMHLSLEVISALVRESSW